MSESIPNKAGTWGASRLYPKAVQAGDLICIRKDPNHFGYFTDAGTVSRGVHNRVWSTVTAVVQDGNWYTIHNDGPIDQIRSSANAKVLVRRLKREVQA